MPHAQGRARNGAQWSDAHSRHLPISILFELKQEGPMLDPKVKIPDAAALDQLDRLLLSVFPRDRTITPDDVRGRAATLRDAVQNLGWPTLESARGKVFYILHDERKERDLYIHDHPSLKGRVMFVRSDESRDDAATLVMDDPRDANIPRLVKAGYFIRTRADSGLRTKGPRPLVRRKAAFDSGADRDHRLPPRRIPGPDGIRRRVHAGSSRPRQSGEWAGDVARAGARPVNESPNVPRPQFDRRQAEVVASHYHSASGVRLLLTIDRGPGILDCE